MTPRKRTDKFDLFIRDFVQEGLQTAVNRRDRLAGKLEAANDAVEALEAAIAAEDKKTTSEDRV